MVNLCSSIEVRETDIKNRLVLPPMQTGKAADNGEVTEGLIDHYENYASDLGLVMIEHSYISREGKYSSGQLGINKDDLVPGLKNLARAARAGGTAAIIQLNHAGLKARDPELNLLDFDYEGSLTKYSLKALDRIVEEFVRAARRGIDAGFDGVEIHGAHGFLLSQFASPITNDRGDEYGGSLDNRIRFPLKIVNEIRKRISHGILSYRLGATDLDPRGFGLSEAKRFAVKLEQAGIDLIDVSGGLCGGSPEEVAGKQGFFVPQAREIKAVVSVPVIGVGGITEPDYANKLIKSGDVDLVAVGRAQLEDSKWASEGLASIER